MIVIGATVGAIIILIVLLVLMLISLIVIKIRYRHKRYRKCFCYVLHDSLNSCTIGHTPVSMNSD